MKILFSKYQGAGNDFIIIDNRLQKIQLSTQQINFLCNRHFGIGADGLMLLENSSVADFKMIYFNSDGKESSMCGNGGRCIVAFAQHNGIITKNNTTFEAIDGLHYAEILNNENVRLQMQDVSEIKKISNDYILNTGSPHFVRLVDNVESINVLEEGRKIRYSETFYEKGINVNFLQIIDKHNVKVRTYERGVENETLSCGTGVTAAALVTAEIFQLTKDNIQIQTSGGTLFVDFEKQNNTYKNIFLTGNATLIFKGEININ
ncbi:MAG: diaminopimelate epimerase [Bacteroidota bacterium]